jgi:hypothetical protein
VHAGDHVTVGRQGERHRAVPHPLRHHLPGVPRPAAGAGTPAARPGGSSSP